MCKHIKAIGIPNGIRFGAIKCLSISVTNKCVDARRIDKGGEPRKNPYRAQVFRRAIRIFLFNGFSNSAAKGI